MMPNNINLIYLNPTPIIVLDFPQPVVSKKDIDTFLSVNMMRNLSNDNGLFLSESQNLIQNNKLFDLKDKFDSAISYYLNNVIMVKNQFSMIHSWIAKTTKDSHHHRHNHPNIMLSAVSYFNQYGTEDTFSNFIVEGDGLNRIFPHFRFTLDVSSWNNINARTYSIQTGTNKILIFPAYLNHYTEINCSETDRYCIGTNYFVSGDIMYPNGGYGSDYNLTLTTKTLE